MSAKFDSFKADLIALCQKHGVTLGPSGYETLEVWDRAGSEDVLYAGIVDETCKTHPLDVPRG